METEKEAAPAMKLAEMKSPQSREMAVPDQKIDMFSSRGFALAQRIAQAFATSDAVPAIFQAVTPKKVKGEIVAWVDNPAAFGNCLVAIETAQAVGMSITAVMQNANIIEGKLSWSGKFIIAAVNASHRFTPLRFDVQNTGMIKATYKEKDGWNDQKKKYNMVEHTIDLENIVWCAWALPYGMDFPKGVVTLQQAKDAGLPVIVGPRVSMRLAVEEGWYAKPGSKWQTEMKDLMGMYRSGAYFGNIHAPDVVMGMGRTTEELQDISTIDVQQQANGQYAAANLDELKTPAQKEDKHPDAETVEVHDKTAAVEPEKTVEAAAVETEARPAPTIMSDEAEKVADMLRRAGTLNQLADASDVFNDMELSKSERDALGAIYKKRYAELQAEPAGTEEKAVAADSGPAKRTRRTTAAAPTAE